MDGGKDILSKYNANKTEVDGYVFDSKAESQYYEYLLKLKAKGKIVNFEMQPQYILQPKYTKFGVNIRAITYIADFLIYHLDGSTEVIDIKGFAVPTATIKKKMFNYTYPNLKLTWLSRSLKYSDTGWIEYDELKKIRAKRKKEV